MPPINTRKAGLSFGVFKKDGDNKTAKAPKEPKAKSTAKAKAKEVKDASGEPKKTRARKASAFEEPDPSKYNIDKLTGNEQFEAIRRMKRDFMDEIIGTAGTVTRREVAFMVKQYYDQQEDRQRVKARHGKLIDMGSSARVLEYLGNQSAQLEANVKLLIDRYLDSAGPIVNWLRSVTGIGPVLAAGLLAFIDIEKVSTAGQIYSYGGYLAGQGRVAGEKLNYNPDLKQIIYKCGKSFVFFKSLEKCYYGKIYDKRKVYEQAKNEAGDYKDQADHILATQNIQSPEYKACLQSGKLSPNHIHMRCLRYAAKMFISHFFEVYYFCHHGSLPPRPFVIEHMGHIEYVRPHNCELFPAMVKLLEGDVRDAIPPTYRTQPSV